MSDTARGARAAAGRTDGVNPSRTALEHRRVNIRAVLVAAVITGFLLAAADVRGHGAPLARPARSPRRGTGLPMCGHTVVPHG
ncbi:hypothetical protein [Streptomyces brevispora]|uniref:Uncharacterized protein n=1 Tax=Streptomyces brevispora TaxID=887462 RepID=A0ABZ1GBH8_9ACTN|nr:hypothetical protein [Streptomyces brevispora]WSC17288.1 hypothetical protein OIE64_33705 [Streptomyces brevispora]